MSTKSGFARLKGLATAGAVGVAGLFGGATARAATVALPVDVTKTSARWTSIDNNANFPSSGSVTTTNGNVIPTSTNAYGIRDATLLGSGSSSGFGDAFDNAMILSVNGTFFVNPDTTVDLTGDTVTSDTVEIVSGIQAQVRYTFFSGRPLVRALFSLTNTSAAPINVNAVIFGDYGSDSATNVAATSSGDTIIDGADFWYITDDSGSGGQGPNSVKPRGGTEPNGFGDPRVTISRYGSGAAVVPTNALTPGPGDAEFGLRYAVTIQPGQTVRILNFAELSDPTQDVAGAAAAAADFESLSALDAAGLLTGLSAQEQGELVNYVVGGTPPPAGAARELPVMGPAGLGVLFGVLGGVGFFELRRRRRLDLA